MEMEIEVKIFMKFLTQTFLHDVVNRKTIRT